MAAYNIYEAKTSFSALVEKAVKGEEVIIAKAGRPVARLVPVATCPGEGKFYRKVGGHEGEFKELLEELDKPWPDDIQRAFGMID